MTDPNTILQQTYGFSAEDLETNRRAQLTPAQQKVIDIGNSFIRENADRYSKTPTYVVIFFILMLILVAGMAYFFAGDSFKQLYGQLGSFGLPVIVGVVILIILWLIYARRSAQKSLEVYRAMGDPFVNKPTVHSIEGRVELVREDDRSFAGSDIAFGSLSYFYAKVRSNYETLKISIPEKDRNPFEPNRTYRLFYVEHGGTRSFLSAEVVN